MLACTVMGGHRIRVPGGENGRSAAFPPVAAAPGGPSQAEPGVSAVSGAAGAALSRRAVDFDKGIIRVEQPLFRAANRLQLGPVKTAAGRRGLPQLGIARNALIHQEDMRLLGGRQPSGLGTTLCSSQRAGRPVEPRNLARSFERIIGRAKLRSIRLHDLRRTTATLLKDLGVPVRDTMEILGYMTSEVRQPPPNHSRLRDFGGLGCSSRAGSSMASPTRKSAT
jgi:hypothetical protein